MFENQDKEQFVAEESLLEAVTNIDESRVVLYGVISAYAKFPSVENKQFVFEHDELMTKVYSDSVISISKADLSDFEKVGILSGLIKDEQSKRKDLGNYLFNKDVLSVDDEEDDRADELGYMLLKDDYDEIIEMFTVPHDQNLREMLREVESTRKARVIKKTEKIRKLSKKAGGYIGILASGYLMHEIFKK